MDDETHLIVNDALAIPRAELSYQASRAGGPGGQHVNTSSTRIEVWWDVAGSPSLSDAQRAQLLSRLAARLDGAGQLRLVAAGSRSQLRNREEVTERLRSVIADALKVRKSRRKTKIPRAAKERRLEEKKKRGDVKRMRGKVQRGE